MESKLLSASKSIYVNSLAYVKGVCVSELRVAWDEGLCTVPLALQCLYGCSDEK